MIIENFAYKSNKNEGTLRIIQIQQTKISCRMRKMAYKRKGHVKMIETNIY